jgi:hypothetical protein
MPPAICLLRSDGIRNFVLSMAVYEIILAFLAPSKGKKKAIWREDLASRAWLFHPSGFFFIWWNG